MVEIVNIYIGKNMRTIKCRAWDKVKKEMIYDPIEYDLRMLSLPVPEKPLDIVIGFTPEADGRRFEVMEWTGMKGIKRYIGSFDIYEGDLVKATYMGKEIYSGEVVFTDGAFCMKIKTVPRVKLMLNSYDIGQTPELHNFENIEIVGNIYQGGYVYLKG